MRKLIISGLIVVATAGQANAEDPSSGNADAAIPHNLHVYNEQGHTYVDVAPGQTSHGCSAKYRYYLDPEHPKYNAIFAMLMAAQLDEREVVIRFYKATLGECKSGLFAHIRGVYLQ